MSLRAIAVDPSDRPIPRLLEEVRAGLVAGETVWALWPNPTLARHFEGQVLFADGGPAALGGYSSFGFDSLATVVLQTLDPGWIGDLPVVDDLTRAALITRALDGLAASEGVLRLDALRAYPDAGSFLATLFRELDQHGLAGDGLEQFRWVLEGWVLRGTPLPPRIATIFTDTDFTIDAARAVLARYQELASLYARYRSHLDGRYRTYGDTLLRAAEGIEAVWGFKGPRRDQFSDDLPVQQLFVCGFYDLTAPQRAFLLALKQTTLPVTVAIPWLAEEGAYAIARRTLEGLGLDLNDAEPPVPMRESPVAVVAEAFLGVAGRGLAEGLDVEGADRAASMARLADVLQIREAESPLAEVRWVARQVVRLIAERGLVPEQIIVTARDVGPVLPVLTRLLEAAGVAVQSLPATTLDAAPLGRYVLAALELAGDDRALSPLLPWLRHPLSGLAQRDVGWFERALFAAGEVDVDPAAGTEARGAELLDSVLAQGPAWRAAILGTNPRVPADNSSLFARLAAIRALQRLDRRPGGATAVDWQEALAAVVPDLDVLGPLPAPGSTAAATHPLPTLVDRATFQATRAALAWPEAVSDALGRRPMRAADMAHWLSLALAAPAPSAASHENRGVRVIPLLDARFDDAQAVFVMGLNEGELPRNRPATELLPRHLFRAVNAWLDLNLSVARSALEEDRMLFHLACSGASAFIGLSRAQRGADGKKTVRSPFLERLLDGLRLREPGAESVVSIAGATLPPLSDEAVTPDDAVMAAAAAAFQFGADGLPSGEADRALDVMGSVASGVAGVGPATGAAPDVLTLARPVETALRPATAVSGEPVKLSAHRLQQQLDCPFKSTAARAWPDTPATLPEFGARERGQWIHAVLERLYRQHDAELLARFATVDESHPDGDTGAAFERHVAGLMQAILEGLQTDTDTEKALITQRALAARIVVETEATLAALARTVRLDHASRALNPRTPVALEWTFDELYLTLPGGMKVELKGRIDRVDQIDGTAQAIVIDYKTGTAAVKDRLKHDRDAQLLLYPLAVEAGLGLATTAWSYLEPASAARERDIRGIVAVADGHDDWAEPLRLRAEQPKQKRASNPWSLPERRAALERIEAAALRLFRGELIPAPADPKLCETCDFNDGLCRHDEARVDVAGIPARARPLGEPLKVLAPPPPNLETLSVIRARAPVVNVSASAGAGKTALLATQIAQVMAAAPVPTLDDVPTDKRTTTPDDDRLAHLIEPEDVKPEQIIAFTFTTKAAAELAERVSGYLRAQKGQRPQSELLGATAEAYIGTIHGFCQTLVRSHALELGLHPGFELMEQPRARRALAASLLDEWYAQADDDERLVLESRGRALPQELDQLVRFHLRRAEDATALRLRADSHADQAVALEAFFVGEARAAIARFVEALDAARHNDYGGASLLKIQQAWRVVESGLKIDPYALPALLAGEWRLDRLIYKGENGLERHEALKAARKALDAHAEAMGALVEPAREQLRRGLYKLAARLSDEFDRYKRGLRHRAPGEGRLPQLDFDDLQLYTLRALRDPTLQKALASRYRLIFIDESQDLDPLQAEIIKALGGPETRRIYVGDAKQSIYRFRDADVRLFLETRVAAAAIDGAFTLSSNYRSVPGVVRFANRLFEGIAAAIARLSDTEREAASLPTGTAAAESLSIFNGGAQTPTKRTDEAVTGPAVEIWLEDLTPAATAIEAETEAEPSSETAPTDDAGTAGGEANAEREDDEVKGLGGQARLVARAVRRMLDDARAAGGDLKPAHIALLFRTRAPMTLFAYALESEGVPTALPLALAESRDRHDLVLLLEAMARPGEAYYEAALFRSPLFALPDTLIAQWNADRGHTTDPRLLAARARLDEWRALVHRADALTFLDTVLAETGWAAKLLTAPDGLSRYSALQTLRRLAQGAGADAGSAFDLLDRLYELDEADDAGRGESETAPTGVVFDTIHGAKGLEWPVVFVVGINKRGVSGPNRNDPLQIHPEFGPIPRLADTIDRANPLKPLASRLGQSLRAAERAEMLRLLYVAVTRAQRRLILVGSLVAMPKTKATRAINDCFLALLSDGLELDLRSYVRAGDRPVDTRAIETFAAAPGGACACVLRVGPLSALIDAVAAGGAAGGASRPVPVGYAALPRWLAGEAAASGARAPVWPPRLEQAATGVPPLVSVTDALTARICGRQWYATRALRIGDVRASRELAERDDGRDSMAGSTPMTDAETHSPGGAAFGTKLHALLERADLRAEPLAEAERLAATWPNGPESEALRASLARVLASAPMREAASATEIKREWPVVFRTPGGGTLYQGTLDLLARMDGRWLLIDYKTGTSFNDEAKRAQYALQLQAYGIALRGLPGAAEVPLDAVLIHADTGAVVEVEMTAAALAGAAHVLDDTAPLFAARSGEPAPTPGAHCRYCPVATAALCPEGARLQR
jgi:ATP-dependent helicase/nuclease subunit A